MTAVARPKDPILVRARTSYRNQRYAEAEEDFKRLFGHPTLAVEALYSAGMCRQGLGDLPAAAAYFEEAIRRQPGHVDANYQLGCTLAARGNLEEARGYLLEALRMKPDHPDAAIKLVRAGGVLPSPPPSSTHRSSTDASGRTPSQDQLVSDIEGVSHTAHAGGVYPNPAGVDSEGVEPGSTDHGGYEILKRLNDPSAASTLALLDKVNISCAPRMSAFIDRLLLQFIIGALLAYVVLQTVQLYTYWFGSADTPVLSPSEDTWLWAAIIVLAAVIWQLLVIATTRYRIVRGRIQVLTGIFMRRWRSVEMFRVIDTQVDRSFAQLLTGDATLVIVTSHGETRLVGIRSHQETAALASRLLTIAFFMRTSNTVRGIIM